MLPLKQLDCFLKYTPWSKLAYIEKSFFNFLFQEGVIFLTFPWFLFTSYLFIYIYLFTSYLFIYIISSYQFIRTVMSDSVNLWTAAHQASLSVTNSRSLFKLISIESVMPSKHLILCHPLLLPPSIFPRIRVFSTESVLCIRLPKYWSFSFNISPSNEHPGLIS